MAAKNTISQRITLEGADEIKKAFDALGKAGEQAFSKIKQIADKVSPGLGGKLQSALDGIRRAFASVGEAAERFRERFARVGIAGAKLGASLRRTATRIGLFGAAVAGATGALVKFTKSSTENADAVGKAAQSVGLSSEAYQELEFAASQSGLSSEEFAKGFNRLNVLLGDAGKTVKKTGTQFDTLGIKVYRAGKLSGEGVEELSKETENARKQFTDLGIKIFDTNGKLRSTEQVFDDLVDALSRIEDPARRAAVAEEFFGKSFAKFLPFILEGVQKINAERRKFRESGIGFTNAEISSATTFNDALSSLQKTITQLRDKAFIKFAEPFRKAFEEIEKIVVANAGKILAVAENAATQFGAIFEDVLNALLGNDQEVKAQWIIDLRDGIVAFGVAAQNVFNNVVLPALNGIKQAADFVGASIGSIIGAEISGEAVLLTLAIAKLSGAFSILYFAINAIIAVFAALGAWPALIIIGLGALAAAIYSNWDAIVAYLTTAWQTIRQLAFDGWTYIAETARSILATVVQIAQETWTAIAQSASETWVLIVESLIALRESIVATFTTVFAEVVQIATDAWQAITDAAAAGWGMAVEAVQAAADAIYAVWQDLTSSIRSLWDDAMNFIKGAIRSVGRLIDGIVGSIQKAISAAKNLIGLGGSTTSKAAGGYISGPGTSTSDSIPARLSNGEFVIKASAVRKYGLDFLYALNGMRLPKGKQLQFSMGGLVDTMSSALMPGFADGGLVSAAAPAAGGRPINVTIAGESFAMSASEDVAEKLIKYASRRRVASAGRKPSWYGA